MARPRRLDPATARRAHEAGVKVRRYKAEWIAFLRGRRWLSALGPTPWDAIKNVLET